MDDCNGIMPLGLADMSHMSIFNDFDETDRDMFHGRIIDLSAEYEKSPFFQDIYKYIIKVHISLQIRGHTLRKLKTECEDCLDIDDVLFKIKVPKYKTIEPLLLLVIPETYVPTILY